MRKLYLCTAFALCVCLAHRGSAQAENPLCSDIFSVYGVWRSTQFFAPPSVEHLKKDKVAVSSLSVLCQLYEYIERSDVKKSKGHIGTHFRIVIVRKRDKKELVITQGNEVIDLKKNITYHVEPSIIDEIEESVFPPLSRSHGGLPKNFNLARP